MKKHEAERAARVSVITAVYNSASTLEASLNSSASQSYANLERIVVDGGSCDGSIEIAKGYSHGIDAFVSEPDEGIYDALNKGIKLCTGEIIGLLHSDDLFARNDTIAMVADVMRDASISAVYGDLVYVDRKDPSRTIRFWRAGTFSKSKLSRGWMPPHPTFFVRRSWYERVGTFDTSYRISADYDLMLRMLTEPDFRVVYLPEIIVKMRVGGVSNRSLRNLVRKSKEDLRAIRSNQAGGVTGILWKNLSKLPQFVSRKPR